MNDKEFVKLKEWCQQELGENFDLFDYEHLVDRTLNFNEAKTELEEKMRLIIPQEEDIKEIKSNGDRFENEQKNEIEKEKKLIMEKEGRINMFEEQANVLLVGRKRSGKTCLGWAFLKQFGEFNRKMYVYRHPRPEVLKTLPFKVENLTNLKQISNLTDAVILFDEAGKTFPVLEKTVNAQLRNILSISAQNNICFIFVCHNSFFLNRSLFSFIDIRIVKEVNEGHWEMERSFMKKLYENVIVMGNNQFFVDSDYMRGNETFKKPEWFSDILSLAYRSESDIDFFEKCELRGKNAE